MDLNAALTVIKSMNSAPEILDGVISLIAVLDSVE